MEDDTDNDVVVGLLVVLELSGIEYTAAICVTAVPIAAPTAAAEPPPGMGFLAANSSIHPRNASLLEDNTGDLHDDDDDDDDDEEEEGNEDDDLEMKEVE